MKTPHMSEQLLLWVEGDLPEGEASTVQAHLAQCPTCRTAAEALQESQAWLKVEDPPPFTFEDRHQLRRDVMAKIQADHLKKNRGGTAILNTRQILLLAVALGLFLVVTGIHRSQPKPSVLVAEQVQLMPVHESVPAPSSSSQRASVRSVQPHRSANRAEAPVAQESTLSRIEIQTGNPQIRIIWLARADSWPAEPDSSTDRFVDPT